jgi:hypothetical protein
MLCLASTHGAEIGDARKTKVANAKPIKSKTGIQMFVQMQGHGRPGLLIFANKIPKTFIPQTVLLLSLIAST